METPDGILVRHLEDLITDQVGLPQSVGVSRKLSGLTSPMPNEAIGDKLAEATTEAERLIGLADPSLPSGGEPWAFPDRDEAVWQKLFPYPNDLAQGAHEFTIQGLCGRLASAQRSNGGDRFALDLGRLYGRTLHLGSFPTEEVAVQDSLF